MLDFWMAAPAAIVFAKDDGAGRSPVVAAKGDLRGNEKV